MVLRNDKFYYCTPSSGKGEVITLVDKLNESSGKDIYGIVDADFDHLTGQKYNNIFLTDKHDAEIMMLNDEFMSDFITEHTKTDFLTEMDIDNVSSTLLSDIINVCNLIGLVKFACNILDVNAMFKGLNYISEDIVLIDNFNVTVDIDLLISKVLERSPRADLSEKVNIIKKYDEICEVRHCHYQTANGHDFCLILSKVFCQNFSNDKNIKTKDVERYLRCKYTHEHFKKTELFKLISSIEENNRAPEMVA
ncbi:hypothetical protein [Photobacterium leiognathi]|uniref:hypothetical protein n=1 Tax=Photobacterium leiognathi TaxID=553611 RepID=UPI003F750881